MELEAAFRLANVVVLFVTLTVAAFTDMTRKKVYNWTTYPAIALGLALGYLSDGLGTAPSLAGPGIGLLDRLVGFGLGFGTFLLFNRAHEDRAVGVGDVKLMGAIGALAGTWLTIWAMFWGSLLGAVIAVWVLLARGELMRGVGRSFMAAIRLGRGSTSVTPTPGAPAARPDPAASPGTEAGAPSPDAAAESVPPERRRIPYGVALSFGTMLAWFLHHR